MTKKELRKIMKQKLKEKTPEQFREQGAAASRRLEESPLWDQYNCVLIYLSMPDELDTSPLLDAAYKRGMTVYAPKVESDTGMRFFRVTPDSSSWTVGAFDIREPAGKPEDVFCFSESCKHCTPEIGARCKNKPLVISPGIAFDREGHRMGRGKGFYDRFYAWLKENCPASKICALCMADSVIEHVVTDEYDYKMDAICTKDEFIEV
jgi:5-formyltetrahydrofolate cyclo-ligase